MPLMADGSHVVCPVLSLSPPARLLMAAMLRPHRSLTMFMLRISETEPFISVVLIFFLQFYSSLSVVTCTHS